MIIKNLRRLGQRVLAYPFTQQSSWVEDYLNWKYDDRNNYSRFDYLLTDIRQGDLQQLVSKKLNKKYLSPLQKQENEFEENRNGICSGVNDRLWVTIPTRFDKNPPLWVHYLINTGSPYTYLTVEAIQALKGINSSSRSINYNINGRKVDVWASEKGYSAVNILGMNFFTKTYGSLTFKCQFEEDGMIKQSLAIDFSKED